MCCAKRGASCRGIAPRVKPGAFLIHISLQVDQYLPEQGCAYALRYQQLLLLCDAILLWYDNICQGLGVRMELHGLRELQHFLVVQQVVLDAVIDVRHLADVIVLPLGVEVLHQLVPPPHHEFHGLAVVKLDLCNGRATHNYGNTYRMMGGSLIVLNYPKVSSEKAEVFSTTSQLVVYFKGSSCTNLKGSLEPVQKCLCHFWQVQLRNLATYLRL